jgi:hypothetical protein
MSTSTGYRRTICTLPKHTTGLGIKDHLGWLFFTTKWQRTSMAHTGTKSMKDDDDTMCYRSELEAAVKAEREACAELCERMARRTQDIRKAALEMAAENIRARGNT